MARPKRNKEESELSPIIETVLETIIWYVIENTEHKAKPPLSDRNRFDKAMQAICGKRDGRSKRNDDALLMKMHNLIKASERTSVSAAARIVAYELSEEEIKNRKEQPTRNSMIARLVSKYGDRYSMQTKTNLLLEDKKQEDFEKLISVLENEKSEARKAALKFIERYFFY